MLKRSDEQFDELLVAYADGELEGVRLAEVEALLEREPSLREEIARLRESAALLRAAFDEDLRSRNPAWGVRDLETVEDAAKRHGLELAEVATMPANNFSVVFRKT